MANRAIRLEADGEGLWLEVGFCSVVYMTFEEAQELAYRVRAFLDASPIPNDVVSATGLEVTRYEAVEDVLPPIAPPLTPTQQSEAEMAGERA